MSRLALFGLMVAVTVHVASFGDWIVEDAAISFAYARNLAEGHGLVPWAGGERVEGYSNPTWVALLAVGQLVGVSPFHMVKVLALGFSAATVPLVYRLGARAAPGAPVVAGMVAAAAFAVNPQVGIFGAAGLENPLVGFLLALGMLAAAREVEEPRKWPVSAVWWLLLALSRPETILYAAIGGLCTMVGHLRAGRGLGPTVRWLALFWVPFLAYHGARYAYFAWPFPMTYYAKVDDASDLLAWNGRGWRYVRRYATQTGHLWFVPVLLAGLGAPGGAWMVRAQALGATAAAVLFAAYTGGDWMAGFRWLTTAAVPGAVLLGAGVVAVTARLGRWGPAVGAVAALVPLAVLDLRFSTAFADKGEIGPWVVRQRVKRAITVVTQAHLDERPSLLTVDMGGYLWWSGMALSDIVGLTDVAFAQAEYKTAMLEAYVLDEVRPHLVNLPGTTGNALRQRSRFHDLYVLVGGDLAVRRDVLFDEDWEGPQQAVGDDVVLGLPIVASPEVAAGEPFFVELGLRTPDGLPVAVRLVLEEPAGEAVAAWDVDLGYGVHPPSRWRGDDFFHGRYALALPAGVPAGRYDLRAQVAVPGGDVAEPVVRGAVHVGTVEQAVAAAEADHTRLYALAGRGQCAEAENAWREARRHRLADPSWAAGHRVPVAQALARCWVEASRGGGREAQQAALIRAREHDPTDPVVLAAIDEAADALELSGEKALAEGRHRLAHRAYREAVTLDPTRSWARRHAEELRR